MTQIDLEELKTAIEWWQDELSHDEDYPWVHVLVKGAAAYLASQSAPTDDLVLCRRVVKGDTTKYYDYVPVDTDKVEAKATTSDYAMSSLPLEIKQKIWSDAAKVEVQAPEAGVEMPERIWAWISKGGIFKWGWHVSRMTPKTASEYVRADIYQNKCAIYSELFKVQRPSGDE